MPHPFSLSFSSGKVFDNCPREFELYKGRGLRGDENTIDLMFGSCFGKGIAAALESGRLEVGYAIATAYWEPDITPKANKHYRSLLRAINYAVEFVHTHFDYVPGSAELPVGLQINDHVWYTGYIDIVAIHKGTKRLTVVDFKTTGLNKIDEAEFVNTEQAPIYAALARQNPVFKGFPIDAHYVVYDCNKEVCHHFVCDSSPAKLMEHLWSAADRVERIEQYAERDFFFPMRGTGCMRYMKRCPFYGVCELARKVHEPIPSVPDPIFPLYSYANVIETLVEEYNQTAKDKIPYESIRSNVQAA